MISLPNLNSNMKKWIIFGLLLVAVAVAGDSSESEEGPACNSESCQLPACRCTGTDIPGGLNPRDVPQLVNLVFNDAINVNNIVSYRRYLYDRQNSNGCPAGATFFVSHEYNDYTLVNELYNRGYEIGLFSITRRTPQTFWAEISYNDLILEYNHQRVQLNHFANIPFEAVKGMRLPFLQLNGDNSFRMMADFDILYDASWPTVSFTNPGLWPYTLDFNSTQDCFNGPCPTSSIPGPWVLPIVTLRDLQGVPCNYLDTCFYVPELNDEEGWYNLIVGNFQRHYLGNRAPFPFNVNQGFLAAHPAVERAFLRFLNLLNNLTDVFMVNSEEVVNYVRNPVTIPQFKQQPCRTWIPTTCNAAFCGPYDASHNTLQYFLQICNVCPDNYPWFGNPLGQ